MTTKKKLLSILATLVIIVSSFSPITTYATENYNGGLAITTAGMYVYSDVACTTVKGSLDDNEGITVLNVISSNKYYIQYSTASGAKEGYIQTNYIRDYTPNTCVGVANFNATVYAGNNTSTYTVVGSIDSGEQVAVLGIAGSGWYYIEYNTSAGRKRGFVQSAALTNYNVPASFLENYLNHTGTTKYVGNYTVYSGPTYRYTQVGSVGYENVISYGRFATNSEDDVYFIVYTVTSTGKLKSGFVFANLGN